MEQKQIIEIYTVSSLIELQHKLNKTIEEGKKEIKEIVINKTNSEITGDTIEALVVFGPTRESLIDKFKEELELYIDSLKEEDLLWQK